MRSLMQTQQHFQAYLLQQDSEIASDVLSTEKVPAVLRLDIYRHAYYSRLLDILQQDYSTLHTLLGDQEFFLLGKRYLSAYPSLFRSVRWYGQYLAKFLAEHPPYDDKKILSELANFEWMLTEVFDSPDQHPLALEVMADIPPDNWPNLCFELHPALRRADFIWNVLPLWHAAKCAADLKPEMNASPIQCLLWRKDYEVLFRSLSVEEAFMIDAMYAGKNFGDICEGLCEWIAPEQVALQAASLLKRHIMDGVVLRVI